MASDAVHARAGGIVDNDLPAHDHARTFGSYQKLLKTDPEAVEVFVSYTSRYWSRSRAISTVRQRSNIGGSLSPSHPQAAKNTTPAAGSQCLAIIELSSETSVCS